MQKRKREDDGQQKGEDEDDLGDLLDEMGEIDEDILKYIEKAEDVSS